MTKEKVKSIASKTASTIAFLALIATSVLHLGLTLPVYVKAILLGIAWLGRSPLEQSLKDGDLDAIIAALDKSNETPPQD